MLHAYLHLNSRTAEYSPTLYVILFLLFIYLFLYLLMISFCVFMRERWEDVYMYVPICKGLCLIVNECVEARSQHLISSLFALPIGWLCLF